MGVAWTEEQKKVIELRGRNILVSAAAGSGKTAVLVERIITMLTDEKHPVSVDSLLIVTFTEAAAAEMKERIRMAIEKKLTECPGNEHLARQATLIHNAQITTIHSFCLSVIRDHFHVIDLDPGFRTAEEGELKLLRHDVLGEMLEERYAKGEKEFLDFVAAYGTGRDDKKLEELILKVYEFSRSYPDADGWLDSCVAAYSPGSIQELEQSTFADLIKTNTKRCLEEAAELIRQGLSICAEEDGPKACESALLCDMQMLEGLSGAQTLEELTERMRGVKWERLAANRDKTVPEEKTAQVKSLREQAKTLTGDLASQYFYQSVQETLDDLKICRPMMKVLAGLVKEFALRFEETKRKKEMIDFSDMEQYALRILTEKTDGDFVPSAAAREYSEQFSEIMIDEYQDSNLIQETILTSVSRMEQGENNIFMVGDVKQSIYRFRLSRPELFMEKYDTYSLGDGKEQRIDLHKNFRSRKEVLESANYLFRQLMTKSLGGIAYDERAALYAGAEYPAPEETGGRSDARTEVLVIDTDLSSEEAESAGSPETISERETEARVIAARIRELIRKARIFDKADGKMRPARYSDIVILTRSIKGFADVFTEVLNREGIPTYAGTREGYFATQEIGVLLDYLRVLNNIKQDIPLAAVLTSYFGRISEQELAIIKSEYQDRTFYEAVLLYCESGEKKEIREKLGTCFGQMECFRKQASYMPMHELLRKIIEDTGYGDFVSAMPGGEQRKANLSMLLEKAKIFEATSYKGVFHFIRYIEQLRKYDVDYGEAALEDEQSDTVRVMTIHKSKGLEFPIVFVAGMGKRFNMQDVRSSVLLHAGLGIGLDAVDLEKRTKSPSLVKKVIQKEEAVDSLGEELRILYVAFTRAKEKLIITGTIANLDKKLESCQMICRQEREELGFGRLSKAVTYWDFLLPALARLTPDVPIDVHRASLEGIVREEVEEETADRMKKTLLRQWDVSKVYDEKVRDNIEEQFGYVYPYAGNQAKKLKFTVSELKKRRQFSENQEGESEQNIRELELGEVLYEEPEVVPLIPRFLQGEEELTGASRGTAYHRVMELLDFTKEYDGERELLEDMNRFLTEGKIRKEALSGVRAEDIALFLACPAGKRMQESARKGKLKKEQPFVLGVDAGEIYPDGEAEEGELILVQGIIDAYFEEEDGLVVLDYKTDKVAKAGELAEKYHIQLDFYAKAVERMTGKKVKEKIIYSFTLKEEIVLK